MHDCWDVLIPRSLIGSSVSSADTVIVGFESLCPLFFAGCALGIVVLLIRL
jgi:hypothetical protein